MGSQIERDKCGICGGDGSKCKDVLKSVDSGNIAEAGNVKLAVIPKGSRHIKINLSSLSVSQYSLEQISPKNLPTYE